MPKWLDHAVFYEIYPQTFLDTNADGIGDFQGIINKLDYIKDLGCNAIWLNPCFVSPFSDAGYDVADYYHTAPRYGTNEDLKRLFQEAHSRGLHVLLDLVPGHTSVEHPWFKASMRPERNEYSDRYIWTDSAWEWTENMPCLRGISQRDGSCAVNFFSTQPALNYGYYERTRSWQQSPEDEGPRATLEEMKNVMRFWLGLGCDGFRVDMAGSLVKDDEGSAETIKLWQDMRAFLDARYPDAVLISEWGEPDKSLQGGFHMDFLLQFGTSHYLDLFRSEHPFFSREGKGDASSFVKTYRANLALTGGKGLMCIPSGNHDTDRLRRTLDPEEMKIAFAFLLSMPGAPFIYYGDEIGMRYVEQPSVEGGYERTCSRTPMQWGRGGNAGFSAAPAEQLYTKMDPAPDAPTAEAQMTDETSLWHEVAKLTALRKANPALCASGGIEFIYCQPEAYPLVYLRTAGDSRILVALNPAAHTVTCPCPHTAKAVLYQHGGPATLENGTLTMPGESAAFLAVE